MANSITAATSPSYDQIVTDDIAFHLGDRSQYELSSLADVLTSRNAPDPVFAAFKPDSGFLVGYFYQKHFDVTPSEIKLVSKVDNGKIMRNFWTVKRDFAYLSPDHIYAFDTEDAIDIDYAEFYGTETPIPVFQYHRKKKVPALITPLFAFHDYPSWNIPLMRDELAFEHKLSKVFWRGAPSGKIAYQGKRAYLFQIINDDFLTTAEKTEILRQSFRFRLCEEFAGSDPFDVGLVVEGLAAFQTVPGFLTDLVRPPATHEEHCRHRYLLALDGNDGPSSWYWQLATNSLVFRQNSEWDMFADNYFEPWTHYIPIECDIDDLYDKFLWCEKHAEACKTIVENAHASWRIVFDPNYQLERRKRVYKTYDSWFT